MEKQVVHSIGLFHTELTDSYSHCAYTQKVRRLITMLSYQGYRVIHYGAGEFDPTYTLLYEEHPKDIEYVELMDKTTLDQLRDYAKAELKTKGTFEGDIASTETTLYKIYHHLLKQAVATKYTGSNTDIFLHHFGWPHQELGSLYPNAIHVEPGIGYPTTFAPYRIFESYAWMNHVLGQQKTMPKYGDYVIPNHFNEDDWKPGDSKRDGVCFMGRISDIKGCHIIGMLSDVIDTRFVLAGQVDPEYLKTLQGKYKKLEYAGVLHGKQRNEFLQQFKVMMLPTQYFEPFGGAIIEGAMSGCVPVTSDFGVFPEIIKSLGFTCRTFSDYVDSVNYVLDYYNQCAPEPTILYKKYGMYALSYSYKHVLDNITKLHTLGWYNA